MQHKHKKVLRSDFTMEAKDQVLFVHYSAIWQQKYKMEIQS